jgi:isoquinoline 1-oxidoreductase beta subunit
MANISKLHRRDFLKASALGVGGLTLGVYLPDNRPWAPRPVSFHPNVFVRIDTDSTVTIWLHKSEMGQGVRTALPMIVADELDADWSTVRVVQADAHPSKYGSQTTVGSRSVRGTGWLPLRQAGAAGREMLVAAAAERWGVNTASCRTESGRVIHDPSSRVLRYGDLVEAAAKLPVPQEPRLKEPSEFRLIGKRIAQIDTPLKVTGKATFGIDVRVPNMLFATVVHSPVFGGTVTSFDANRARRVPGVKDVVEVSQGVAVVAENTWAAFQGAKALEITWNSGQFSMSSSDISRSLVQLAEREGAVARDDGDVEQALHQAAQRVSATYEVPFLAHATMEPMNCTADVRSDRCEIWVPSQNPQGDQRIATGITGLPVERVTVHVTYLGCGLGRRSRGDFVRDAVETSMKVGGPVQVVWTREEDMQHDFYRPAAYNRFDAGLDANGRVTALKLRIAGLSILRTARGRSPEGGLDRTSVEGAANMPYRIPNVYVDYCLSEIPVPVGWWRSVGPSQNTFIVESFVDELAHAAGRDPFQLRRELLSHEPRLRYVLELAAEKSGWGTALPAGRARGIALVEDKGGRVAQVAEVSFDTGQVRVHRVTCAADFGQIINPDTVEAQVAGSIVTGLSAALYGEITLEGGRVKQGNFDDYPLLRIDEMPEVEVHVIPSTQAPGGVGEPAVPPIAPAVTNALFALTGKRIRKLPIRAETFTPAVGGSGSGQ